MTDSKLALCLELSNKIKDIKQKIRLCDEFARETFTAAKYMELHPEYHAREEVKVSVRVEYSDGHFGNTLKLDIPNAYACLDMCKQGLLKELEQLEHDYCEL